LLAVLGYRQKTGNYRILLSDYGSKFYDPATAAIECRKFAEFIEALCCKN
jgi:hypothetical protein